jgi:hypothetical protein
VGKTRRRGWLLALLAGKLRDNKFLGPEYDAILLDRLAPILHRGFGSMIRLADAETTMTADSPQARTKHCREHLRCGSMADVLW